jgi:hypothetical protein
MSHKFKVRQMVRMKQPAHFEARTSPGGVYEVVRLMPSDETGKPSYRIKSATTERAVRESEIRAT